MLRGTFTRRKLSQFEIAEAAAKECQGHRQSTENVDGETPSVSELVRSE